MSYSVSGTMITLTRGDTFTALITITDCIWQVCLRHRADKSNGRSGHLHYQSNS